MEMETEMSEYTELSGTPMLTSSSSSSKMKKGQSANLYFGKIVLPKTKGKVSSIQQLENLDSFLEDEKLNNQKDGWSKLDKMLKLKKLADFAKLFGVENNLTEEEIDILSDFLKESLEKKKLYRVKDLIYNKDLGAIKCIPGLVFHKQTQRFSLKVHDTVITRKSKPTVVVECV